MIIYTLYMHLYTCVDCEGYEWIVEDGRVSA